MKLRDGLRVGDIVRNITAVRTNPVVNEMRGTQPIEAGYLGIVLDVRPDVLNSPPMGDYVDVMLSVDGEAVRCGNYGAGFFKAVA